MNLSKRTYSILFPSVGNIIFLVLFLYLSFTGQRLLDDGDTGFHIKAGEFMLENHIIPKVDIFSHHTPAIRWIAHEWLSEVIMGKIHKSLGLNAVVISFSFIISLIFYFLYKNIRATEGNIILTVLLVVLSAMTSYFHWLARPHMFSIFFLLVWYFLLDEYQYRNRKTLFYLPFIMILWVNLHGGFILGFLMIGVYFLGNVIAAFISKGSEIDIIKKKVLRYFFIAILCLAATFVNPYGYEILGFPFAVISDKNLVSYSSEYLSPDFHHIYFIFFEIYLFFAIVLLMISRKKLNVIEGFLIILFIYMSLYSCRNIPLFAIIIAPILMRQINCILKENNMRFVARFKNKSAKYADIDRISGGFLWPGVGVSLVIFLMINSNSLNFKFSEKMRKPVSAVEFLKKESIKGNMFNADEFGDYIIYSAFPQYKVFIDGRIDIYMPEIFKDYQAVTEFKSGWEDIINKYEIKWIIYDKDSQLCRYLMERKDWRIIYSDDVANIFVRNTPEFKDMIGKYNDLKWRD